MNRYPNRPRRDREEEPPRREPRPRSDTSWEKSADWYDRIIGAQGSELYQRVVIPGALRLLDVKAGEKVLDLGCGQGVFTRALAEAGAEATGVDSSPALIQKARSYPARAKLRYLVRDAAKLRDLDAFDAITSILALQNMAHLDAVCQAGAGILQKRGRFLWVINHPCFRIPKQSSWGFEEHVQYRRIDAYSTPMNIPIVMHPGMAQSESTTSFHYSLADLMRPAFEAGFRLAGLEEWHSDKISEPGPRARIENRARQEFPLFLALLWSK
jgi:ubiquinone/menaquinone biosynthesis C-methylase UbiE